MSSLTCRDDFLDVINTMIELGVQPDRVPPGVHVRLRVTQRFTNSDVSREVDGVTVYPAHMNLGAIYLQNDVVELGADWYRWWHVLEVLSFPQDCMLNDFYPRLKVHGVR